ncbi:MAG: hypothetical protein Q8R26_03145 [bacterium]|nr:hypothetical protein [bacterium]
MKNMGLKENFMALDDIHATWQGWLSMLIFIGIMVWNFLRIDSTSL